MRVIAISNAEDAESLFQKAQRLGYITFIYHHADPHHDLSEHKFSYVGSDQELMEKLRLLREDFSVREEMRQW